MNQYLGKSPEIESARLPGFKEHVLRGMCRSFGVELADPGTSPIRLSPGKCGSHLSELIRVASRWGQVSLDAQEQCGLHHELKSIDLVHSTTN
jgi:hypothetical protein